MAVYSGEQLLPLIQPHGRTWFDQQSQGIWFNWTCSGFTVTFTGKTLRAKILAFGDVIPIPGGEPTVDYPCIGLVGEDGKTLTKRLKCMGGPSWYDLFSGEESTHTVRIVKLSENARGKAALLALETDGELVQVQAPKGQLSIEFVGDSITCGFGNEAPGRDSLFKTHEENGWDTYGAVAGRELNAEFNMVSVSGIAASTPKTSPILMHQMDQVYEFTDVYCFERLERPLETWDFAHHPKDIVVINLGTNDASPIRSYTDLATADQEERSFSQGYRELVEKVRELNGPDTWILCVLGPMDYYLYDAIEKTVETYRQESGDPKIRCFKLIGINLMTEGIGAASHPSSKTHLRVGKELAARIRSILH